MKYLRKYDIAIILISIAGIILSFFMLRQKPENKVLAVYIDGKKQLYSLRDSQFRVDSQYGYVKVKVTNGKAKVIESSCHDGWCKRMGWIDSPGDSAVCLPSRIMIVIENQKGAGEGADAVTK
jgi:hypothetical protein